MRVVELLYEMTAMDAMTVFKKVGIDVSGMNPAQIKDARNQLIRKYHPDLGGDVQIAKMINAAYDVLKTGVMGNGGGGYGGGYSGSSAGPSQTAQGPFKSQREARKARYPNTPEWAWAGYSGGLPDSGQIYRNNYTDIGFIKKTMWEKSGKSKQEYTVWGFDGTFFRNVFTCYGSPRIFGDMAQAMFDWQTKGGNPYKCRAIFVAKGKSKDLYLLYADGKFYADNPIKAEHNSFNGNPGNDRRFQEWLPEFLDGLMK